MGNYKARRPGFLLAWQINAAERMFRGEKDEQIAVAVFSIRSDLPPDERKKKVDAGKQRLRRLRKDPKFMEYYKSIVTEWKVHNVGKAMNRLAEQIDATEPWLANKAANDVLNHAKDMFESEDANTVTVKFEGMPEIGSPDVEEQDAVGSD